MSNNNYIWLFGENDAETANNNSFYFWKHIVGINDGIDKYFVLKKNEDNLKIYNNLTKEEQSFTLWHNSSKHRKIFNNTDLFFVLSSKSDVFPNNFKRLNNYEIKKPFIFLQKYAGEMIRPELYGNSYDNYIFRFCGYNDEILNNFNEKNNFKNYQLYNLKYPPRFCKFIKEIKNTQNQNQIMWFIEWRDYTTLTDSVVDSLLNVLKSKNLKNYLKKNNLKLKLCLHHYFKKGLFNELYDCEIPNLIEIVYEFNIDLNKELAKTKLLITDYSSVVYDFAFLNRPIILFQKDLDEYSKRKTFYLDLDELEKYRIKNEDDLVSKIISDDLEINPIFNKFWSNIDYNCINENKQIDDAYTYFSNIQKNKISFIGYNFYGVGGTVNATKALAEGLLEKGCLVELISLKKIKLRSSMPYGVQLSYVYHEKTLFTLDKIKRFFHSLPYNFKYLKNDSNNDKLHPSSGYYLAKLMKSIKTHTLVSTRESLHFFLNDCSSDKVKNKIYFFHAPADTLDIMYPGVVDSLKKIEIDKAIFVTESNRLALEELHDYHHYKSYITLGNSLEQSKMISREEIEKIEKKDLYRGIYLLRISKDRKDDLINLINFGKYLKENNVQNLVLDVFGAGSCVDEFLDALNRNNLREIIFYRKKTNNPSGEIQNHDFMIDLTLNHSFGMIYIEGVFNGKKVFCMKNPGSTEVLEGIPNSYIESFEWLHKQATHIDEVSLEELQDNYDKVAAKYSRDAVASKFIDFLD